MTTGRILSYLYDNRGNQTQRIINNAPDKSWPLTWDYENRLTGIEKSKGSGEKRTTTFKYDPLGRRIEKRHVTLKDGITKTTTTSYVYDGDSIILETIVDGAVTTKTFYTHGIGIDEPLAMERNGQYYYYHADGLGSVTAITDAGGSVVQSYGYDSFGRPRLATNFRNSYQFTGREWDKETGLYYYRARYYDPMEGRFISKDPIGFAGGDVNLYGYVQNNPINYTDPLGLEIWICNRKTDWGGGNHAYLWDDRPTTSNPNKSCGMRGSSGNGDNCGSNDSGPYGGDNCRLVINSAGKEEEIMRCCRGTSNNGPWVPGVHDCHDAADRCIKGSGLRNPGAPGGRVGKPCDPCPSRAWDPVG